MPATCTALRESQRWDKGSSGDGKKHKQQDVNLGQCDGRRFEKDLVAVSRLLGCRLQRVWQMLEVVLPVCSQNPGKFCQLHKYPHERQTANQNARACVPFKVMLSLQQQQLQETRQISHLC